MFIRDGNIVTIPNLINELIGAGFLTPLCALMNIYAKIKISAWKNGMMTSEKSTLKKGGFEKLAVANCFSLFMLFNFLNPVIFDLLLFT